jgi:uncharacterized repeat protein (TIGR03803 family)
MAHRTDARFTNVRISTICVAIFLSGCATHSSLPSTSSAVSPPTAAGSTVNVKKRTHSSSFTVLHQFNKKDGSGPLAGVIEDNPRNLYGTTFYGGGRNHADGRCRLYGGCGVAYKIDSSGAFSVLHRFGARGDGGLPWAGRLLLDASGNLFGTTQAGGTHKGGTVFEITSSGSEKSLYSFCSKPNCADGQGPLGALVMDAAGNLYGTTLVGGSTACSQGCGTVFKLDGSRRETVLVAFDKQNGEFPDGVIFGPGGDLYGETDLGGGNTCAGSFSLTCGLIYRVSPNGGQLHVIYQFPGGTAGGIPHGGLTVDPSGNLFGTNASDGSPQCSCGVAFEITPNANEKVLHTFIFGSTGSFPESGVIRDSQGNLFGTTLYGGKGQCVGGPSGCGVVFEIDSGGSYIVLHEFSGGTDGGVGYAGLFEDRQGNLYGTTSGGGTSGDGVVFKITP